MVRHSVGTVPSCETVDEAAVSDVSHPSRVTQQI